MPSEILVKSGTVLTWKAAAGDYAITLASIAIDAARQGAKGDLTTPRGRAWLCRLTVNMDVAPTAGRVIEVYWAGSPTAAAGDDNPGAASGSNAAYTGSTGGSVDETKSQLTFIGVLPLTPDADGVVQVRDIGVLIPYHQYGMPVLVNKSDQALEGDDDSHQIEFFELIDESQ